MPGANVAYLAFNTTQAPFDQPEVRKALNMAIDKQAIVDKVFHGAAVAATTPIPPSVWSYADALAADALRSRGGARDARRCRSRRPVDEDLGAAIGAALRSRCRHRTAEMIQADLAAVGVKSEIVSRRSRRIPRSGPPTRTATAPSLFGWTSDNGDPDNFLSILLGCDAVADLEPGAMVRPAFRQADRRGATLTIGEARAAAYKQAQAIFVDEAPWAAIAHAMETAALARG